MGGLCIKMSNTCTEHIKNLNRKRKFILKPGSIRRLFTEKRGAQAKYCI